MQTPGDGRRTIQTAMKTKNFLEFQFFQKNFFGRKTAKFRYFFYFSVTFSKKLQKNFFALHLKNQQETLEIISTLQKSNGKIYRKLTN